MQCVHRCGMALRSGQGAGYASTALRSGQGAGYGAGRRCGVDRVRDTVRDGAAEWTGCGIRVHRPVGRAGPLQGSQIAGRRDQAERHAQPAAGLLQMLGRQVTALRCPGVSRRQTDIERERDAQTHTDRHRGGQERRHRLGEMAGMAQSANQRNMDKRLK